MRNFNDDIIWGYGKHPTKWYSGTTGVWGRKYQDDREKMKQQSDEILHRRVTPDLYLYRITWILKFITTESSPLDCFDLEILF